MKIVEEQYWEEWAKDVAKLAQQHIEMLQKLADDAVYRCDFTAFLEHLRRNLNNAITEQDAVEMLAQHIITKPVFDALFDSEDFSKNNPVAQGLDKVVALLEDAAECSEKNKSLEKFYKSVRARVHEVKTAEGRQKIIIELYDKFFKTAFPKLSDKLGIVYTPVEVVDFMIKSVDQALRQEFGKGIGAKDVHILDPFTGTGTFIVRLFQSGLIDSKDLKRKYHEELHANEIVLLTYYIAAVNIENTYHEQFHATEPHFSGCGSESFPGIVHADTFAMTPDKKVVDHTNSTRTREQQNTPITIIMGNPPYSVGQKSQNDNNKNTPYPQLDKAIRDSYAAHSTATNKTSLYDSYIRAFRWASTRIGDKGIICYVTNGGFIDGKAMDGFRKCLAEEFTDIYVFNLRGGVRGRSGDAARKEGKNIFPIMTAVAITLLIKNPAKKDNPCSIHYREIDDYLDRNKKLQIIAGTEGLQGMTWQNITPNEKHDWINQRDELFDTLLSLGDKKNKNTETVFEIYSGGVQTNRDSWCWNFSRDSVKNNMARMVEFYNMQVEEYAFGKSRQTEKINIDQFVAPDPTKISWTRSLKNALSKGVKHSFDQKNIVCGLYRPFCKQYIYYNRVFNEYVNKMPQIFPEPGIENVVICMSGSGAVKKFCATISNTLPDVEMVEKMQCFPLYLYKQIDKQNHVYQNAIPGSPSGDCSADDCNAGEKRLGDYVRRENISDTMLQKFREHYGERKITKEDIFYYVYGILHSRCYQERFAVDLKKQLPRIPFADDFRTFSQAGRQLAELHLNYDTVKMYPLKEIITGTTPDCNVEQMRYAGKTDKSRIIYNASLTLDGIPPEAGKYMVNGKSALDWVVERYTVTTHKDSGIVNDPNDWCAEIGNERYIVDLIKRIVTLSVESVRIIDGLPMLKF